MGRLYFTHRVGLAYVGLPTTHMHQPGNRKLLPALSNLLILKPLDRQDRAHSVLSCTLFATPQAYRKLSVGGRFRKRSKFFVQQQTRRPHQSSLSQYGHGILDLAEYVEGFKQFPLVAE